jgi:hypothetical protein
MALSAADAYGGRRALNSAHVATSKDVVRDEKYACSISGNNLNMKRARRPGCFVSTTATAPRFIYFYIYEK